MNLAQAIGVTFWRDSRQITDSQPMEPVKWANLEELWCWSENLDSFWDDEQDLRWCLLVSIAQSIGVKADQLFPCDQAEDKPIDSAGLSFGQVNEGMLELPSLHEMIEHPLLKKQAWHLLCHHF